MEHSPEAFAVWVSAVISRCSSDFETSRSAGTRGPPPLFPGLKQGQSHQVAKLTRAAPKGMVRMRPAPRPKRRYQPLAAGLGAVVLAAAVISGCPTPAPAAPAG